MLFNHHNQEPKRIEVRILQAHVHLESFGLSFVITVYGSGFCVYGVPSTGYSAKCSIRRNQHQWDEKFDRLPLLSLRHRAPNLREPLSLQYMTLQSNAVDVKRCPLHVSMHIA